MIRTINSHNVEAGVANMTFERNDIVIAAQDYVLIDLIPGTRYVMASMGIEFDETFQLRAIEYLTARLTDQIDSGAIKTAPVQAVPEYVAPPESPEPEAEEPTDPEVEE